MAPKRVVQKYDKPFDNRTTDQNNKSTSAHKKKKTLSNNKNVRTFEEIHEHIDETFDSGSQYQASEPFGSETLPHKNPENIKNKKKRNRIKSKIKHHHHHHHHNHIKELIKTIPQPYSVEKLVHVPIEKVVEKVVHVPKIINVTIEKIVHVPIEKIVEKVIHIPKPYVVEKIVEKIIHVPKPFPVLRTVPYPIEIKVPIPIEKKVPFPFKVEIERKVPIYIQTKEPYTFEKSSIEHYNQVDQLKSNIERDLGTNHPHNRIYKLKELNLPNKIEDLQYIFQTENNKHLRKSGSHQYTSASETVLPSKSDLLVDMNIEEHRNLDITKSAFQQNTSASDNIPLTFLSNNLKPDTKNSKLYHTGITLPLINNTTFILSPEESTYSFHGIPFSLSSNFAYLQPTGYQNHLSLDSSMPKISAESSKI
ncbi:uncharacterized protein LOC111081143 [Drosophila obscura]|uniref:uncharacterized protein LOC111081143 n=1 Tax=Drosophila obscura TaxID=7282 RepID=UPI001BB18147|nr:uncharacterized protein LOC111081143 [Drosophila obscura]